MRLTIIWLFCLLATMTLSCSQAATGEALLPVEPRVVSFHLPTSCISTNSSDFESTNPGNIQAQDENTTDGISVEEDDFSNLEPLASFLPANSTNQLNKWLTSYTIRIQIQSSSERSPPIQHF
ncbi:MAG: hypothetical protein AB7P14_23115 [Blastocatellales bacterium]